MGRRDLLFLTLILGGAAALGSSLIPAFAPLRESRPPASIPASSREPIVEEVDRVLGREWAGQNLDPAPRAPELAVMRRLSLALTGTIPSLQEIRRFEARPEGARLRPWLDGLLTDRRCADYLAERLARSYVGTEDGPFLIYRRRRFASWLSDELMRNRPYDALVRELIAGQGLWTDHPATNFVTVTIDAEIKEPAPERLAARVARAFLGVRLDCAQCHNHPFQPWTQADFRGLTAFFGQVHYGFSGVHDGGGEFLGSDRKTGVSKAIEPRVPFAPELCKPEGNRRERLADWVTDPKNPYLPRATVNRAWALMFGRPLVEPVDDLVAAGDPPPVLTLLADDFAAHGYNLRRLLRTLAETAAFGLDSANGSGDSPGSTQDEAWAAFPMTRLRPEQVAGALLQASSLETIDARTHIFVRLTTQGSLNEFVKRHGDTGEDEFDARGGTIPQRLLLMNGDLVHEKTKDDLANAASRISMLAPTDRSAVETAYLAVLTRRPTPEEAAHFEGKLAGTSGPARKERMADLYWTLLNSTEFSWNH